MARPKKVIDEKQVFELAQINCSYAEIAAVLDCDPKTLSNRFSQAIQKGRESGKSSLKRCMWTSAMGGNVVMMIWLSKQMLGYTDKRETEGVMHVIESKDVEKHEREYAELGKIPA